MANNYVPTKRATTGMIVPVDGDGFFAESFNLPLKATANRTRYAASVFAANFRAEMPKTAVSGSGSFRSICVATPADNQEIIAACGDPEGGNALSVCCYPGGAWYEINMPFDVPMYGSCWDPAVGWVFVGAVSGGSAAICTQQSVAPIAPIARTSPAAYALRSCASNGSGLVVAVGDSSGSTPTIVTTSNGTSWTARTAPINCNLTRVIYYGGLFVAAGDIGGSTPVIMRSADGISWTQCSVSGVSAYISGLTHDGERFLACGSSGEIARSSDGVSWTSDGVSRLAAFAGSRGFCADPVSGVLVAQRGGSDARLVSSIDGGNTWDTGSAVARVDAPLAFVSAVDIQFGARRFVAACGSFHLAQSLAR